jgi:hypothetical protein
MSSSSENAKPAVQGSASGLMAPSVVFLFLAWGFTTPLSDPFIAELKGTF